MRIPSGTTNRYIYFVAVDATDKAIALRRWNHLVTNVVAGIREEAEKPVPKKA